MLPGELSGHSTLSTTRPIAIYVAATLLYAAPVVRSLLLPLRVGELGGDQVQVGLIVGSWPLIIAVLALPGGLLGDRLGRMRVLVVSNLAGAVTMVGLGLSNSLPPLYFFQMLGGASLAFSTPALLRVLVESVPRPRLGRALGWYWVTGQAGSSIAPAVAGYLSAYLGLRGVLACAAVLPLISLGVILAAVRTGPGVPVSFNLPATLHNIARQPGVPAIALVVLAVAMMWGTFNGFFAVFGKLDLKLSTLQIGLLLGISAVSNIISRPLLGTIVDRVPSTLILGAIGALGGAAMLLFLPFTYGFWLPALLIFLGAPFVSAAIVAGNHGFSQAVSGAVGGAAGGAAMGVYTAISFGGQGLGGPLFGPLIQYHGWQVGFTTAALVTAILALAALVVGQVWKPRATGVVSDIPLTLEGH
jgi:MFS family permease